MTAARGDARDLEAMVDQSDLVARVRVLGTRTLEPGEHPHLDSEARVEVLEDFRGFRRGDLVRIRFLNPGCGPRRGIGFAPGEDCLLMAKADFEGTFAPADDEEGKQPVDAGYPVLAASIRGLCGRPSPRVALDGTLSLRARPGTSGTVRAGDAVLEVRVENWGQEPL